MAIENEKKSLTSTQKFILLVFGAMLVAGLLSLFGLFALSAKQSAPGSNTPNADCKRAHASASDIAKGRAQTYFDTDFTGCQVLGMSQSAAAAYLQQHGVSYRIGSRDGESFLLTADFSDSRVTLEIVRGVVRGYSVG